MQWPLAPPRALNATADAFRACTWSSAVSTGDSNVAWMPDGQRVERLVARTVIPEPDRFGVDLRTGVGGALLIVRARTGGECECECHGENGDPTLPSSLHVAPLERWPVGRNPERSV